MRRLNVKHSKKRRQLINGNVVIRSKRQTTTWAKPYNDPNIINAITGLGGNFEYSPIFMKCATDTWVELTGYRRKDYIIAEDQTGKKHQPKVTVWHHAWDEKDGKYRMQLVDFVEHKKTCPHAGGCKLWLTNTEKRSKYASSKQKENYGNYSDLSPFYPIESAEINFYQKGYVSKKTMTAVKRKKAKLCGVDVYGNLLYKNCRNIYFWDHESDLLILIKHVR